MLTTLLLRNLGQRASSGGILAPTATISGTASGGLTESDVVTGGKTIIITLANDTWVADDGTFAGIRQDIIDGLDSNQSETTGWNAEVRDKEVVGAVVRTSDTIVTITLTAASSYNVTSDETITVTVPATAVSSASVVIGSPTFDVTAYVAPAPTPTGSSGGGGYRHYSFGGYDDSNPVVAAVKEEIKILQVEKQSLAKVDTTMLDAINERLAYLRKLLKDRDRMFLEAEQDYNYQARIKLEQKIEKRNKRARRLRAIARLLH